MFVALDVVNQISGQIYEMIRKYREISHLNSSEFRRLWQFIKNDFTYQKQLHNNLIAENGPI